MLEKQQSNSLRIHEYRPKNQPLLLEMEHIGSTSVERMCAKPTIDMLLVQGNSRYVGGPTTFYDAIEKLITMDYKLRNAEQHSFYAREYASIKDWLVNTVSQDSTKWGINSVCRWVKSLKDINTDYSNQFRQQDANRRILKSLVPSYIDFIADKKAPLLLRPRNFQWFWNSAADPWLSEEWQNYNDIENEIIEDAYNQKEFNTEIDGDRIVNVECMLQHNKHDESNLCSIKRVQVHQEHENLRKKGKKRKEKEAQWLAHKLRDVKTFGRNKEVLKEEMPEEIGETCVYLYTKQSFWYKLINETLRLFKRITTELLKTLRPFCFLLDQYLTQHISANEYDRTLAMLCDQRLDVKENDEDISTVYRGVTLTDEEREQMMDPMMGSIIFTSFTSTNLNKRDCFYGKQECGVYVANISQFPIEEEFLIKPVTMFQFVKYHYDNFKKKHILYLKLY
ncbi:hypothetical protein I4U23_011650 [Adineta vaga]|nr:hypothetical protein I4U23_011650 [Adineta vaga]